MTVLTPIAIHFNLFCVVFFLLFYRSRVRQDCANRLLNYTNISINWYSISCLLIFLTLILIKQADSIILEAVLYIKCMWGNGADRVEMR